MLDNQNEFWIQLCDDYSGTKFSLFKRLDGFDEAWDMLKEDVTMNPVTPEKDFEVIYDFVQYSFLREAHPEIFGEATDATVIDLCVLTHMLLCERAMQFRPRHELEALNRKLLMHYRLQHQLRKLKIRLTY